MSPTPGRSTLITSAPNHARSCVQVGPDCTWVKSRMRTPVSALVISSPPENLSLVRARTTRCRSLLLQHALRIEIADASAFGARRRIDHCVDQGRLAGIHRFIHRALQLVGGRG